MGRITCGSSGGSRTALVLAAAVAVLAAVLAGLVTTSRTHSASPQAVSRSSSPARSSSAPRRAASRTAARGGESAESVRGAAAVGRGAHGAGHRRPGRVLGGVRRLTGLRASAALERHHARQVRRRRHPDYRDYYSNSSGGAGLVTGRITGLAADDHGHVYAAGADGGVWRSTTGGGNWTADRGHPAVALLGRPGARSATARSGTRRARRTPAARAMSATASTASPTRRPARSRAANRVGGNELGVDHDQRAPLRGRQGLGRDAARRLVALADGDDRPWTLSFARIRVPAGRARSVPADAGRVGDDVDGSPTSRTRRTRTSSTTSRSTRRTRTT